jgi:hypothetical protein
VATSPLFPPCLLRDVPLWQVVKGRCGARPVDETWKLKWHAGQLAK